MTWWGLVLLVILADTAGNLCLARGMRRGTVAVVALGVVCMTVSFSAFATLLSRHDLSLVLPATAAGYVLNTLGAVGVLKERVTSRRWLGTALIGLGVALVSLTA